jgi:signal transduction histidine kinase/CheY-like chemotaxis protein
MSAEKPVFFAQETTSELPRRGRLKCSTKELLRTSEAQIVILAGRDRGKRFTVTDHAVIGRQPSAHIWVNDEGVSGSHASITHLEDGKFYLKDLGSRNGTRVNGVSVAEQELAFGDKISVGVRTVLVFTYADPLEEQLLQLQKLEAIGRLAAGVAHEFNNLLAVVINNLSLLQQNRIGEEERQVCIEEARQAAGRGAELTRRMLDYSRLSDSSTKPIDLSQLLAEITRLVDRIFDPSISVESEIEEGLAVQGDRLQLYQAVMNLLINAKDALPEGGQLRLCAEMVDVTSDELDELPNLGLGPHAKLTVADTGAGMDPNTLQRACDPFFTTKAAGQGTGLGLSMARGIAHSHGGEIAIESQERRGTTVRVYLPLMAVEERVQDGATAPAEERRFTGTALVIDDDLLVCRSLARTLRLLGFGVIVAESGEQGLSEFEAHRDEVELVVLDVVMPGMGGEETLLRLREIDPNVCVLVSSGYTEEEVIKRMIEEGARGFLKKPYEMGQLKEAIYRVLGPES